MGSRMLWNGLSSSVLKPAGIKREEHRVCGIAEACFGGDIYGS